MKTAASFAAVAALLTFTTPAVAASDYVLQLDAADGQTIAPLPVDSFSFGACNAGCMSSGSTKREIAAPRDAASGMASGKRSGVATGAGAAAGAALAASPEERHDLIAAGALDEVRNFRIGFDKSTPELAKLCQGKHIAKATLRSGTESFEVSDATLTCTTPARISTNLTVPKQTQTQSFGERCADGSCTAGGPVTMTFTSGQMRHNKTGHVTILK